MERNVVVQIIINGLFKIYTSYSGDAKKKKKEIECFFFFFLLDQALLARFLQRTRVL